MRAYSIRTVMFAALFLGVSLNLNCVDAADMDLASIKSGPLSGKLDRDLIPSVTSLRDGRMSSAALTLSLNGSLSRSLPAHAPDSFPLTLDVPHVNATSLAAIQATGATIQSSSVQWNSVSISATLEQVASLVDLPEVRTISLARKPFRRQQGTANNQGDISMKADQARVITGKTGAGQKIGVVSDSINKTSIGPGIVTGAVPNATLTKMANQNSGDLPASIQVIDFGADNGTDEGAAMLEVIHDVAPNAALAFAGAGADQPSMAANLLKLKAAGCTITVDDVGFSREPFFQDGPIAQAIRTNYNAGVTHFTAVGNDGDAGVIANYQAINGSAAPDSSPTNPSGNFFHNWNIGGATPGFLPIVIPAQSGLSIILQWNQPFQSFNLGAGSSVDLDEYLYDSSDLATAHILSFSVDQQFFQGNASGNPVEVIENYSNTSGADKTVYLALNLVAGSSANLRMRVVFLSDRQLSFPLGGVSAMTAFGHTTLNEAVAVGAVFYGDIDSGGKWAGVNNDEDPNAVNAEPNSSKGGIGSSGAPFYFDTTGNPLPNAPQFRDAPAIAAPDGVNTTFYGAGDNTDVSFTINGTIYDSDSLPNFFGTSASVANAAGVAALLLERAPLSTPTQIKAALQSTAIDIIATSPLSVQGPDDRTGAGLINALAAVNAVPAITSNPVSQTILAGDNTSFSVSAIGAATLVYQWQKNGTNIPGANNPTLSLTSVPLSDDNSTYRCIVSNSTGTAGSTTATLTVHQGPVITQQPASVIVNIGSTGTFSVQAVNGFLTYQWLLNGIAIPNATSSTYTTPTVTTADDGALYSVIVSNQFGGVTSNGVTLTANAAPALISGPTATPQATIVGQSVTFSASASGARGQAVSYSWNFGDGNNAIGASVSHAYPVAENYTVTLTVTDLNGAVTTASLVEIIFVDANGDGLPDLDPLGDNSNFVNAFQTIKGLTPTPLNLKTLTIGLNFAKPGKDNLSLTGTLPVPVGFNAAGQNVIVIVGGIGREFVLSSKGKAIAMPSGAFQLTFNARAKAPQFGRLSIKLTKSMLQNIVAASSGLTNTTVTKVGRVVRATVFFNNAMYDVMRPQTYTAKAGKTGKTK